MKNVGLFDNLYEFTHPEPEPGQNTAAPATGPAKNLPLQRLRLQQKSCRFTGSATLQKGQRKNLKNWRPDPDLLTGAVKGLIFCKTCQS
jgi:hypothetical protein